MKKYFFSDESSAQQFSAREYRVWRSVGSRYEEKYTSPVMKHPPSQMIWGAMSFMVTAGLYSVPPGTTINGKKYVNL